MHLYIVRQSVRNVNALLSMKYIVCEYVILSIRISALRPDLWFVPYRSQGEGKGDNVSILMEDFI